jgi:hypothetical protein
MVRCRLQGQGAGGKGDTFLSQHLVHRAMYGRCVINGTATGGWYPTPEASIPDVREAAIVMGKKTGATSAPKDPETFV